jgi:hypothetical protein
LLALINNWILSICFYFYIIYKGVYFILNFRIGGKYALFWLWMSLLTLNPINYLTLINCLQSINILWIRNIHFFWIRYLKIHICLLSNIFKYFYIFLLRLFQHYEFIGFFNFQYRLTVPHRLRVFHSQIATTGSRRSIIRLLLYRLFR